MSVKSELYKHRAILIIGFIMIFFAFDMTIGIMALIMRPGFAAGPAVLGAMAEAAGNYSFGLTVYGSMAILAALTLVTVKPRFWTPPSRRPQEVHQ